MTDPSAFQVFQGSAHRPYYRRRRRMAALLIHGFPGTPAEFRPLERVLARRGWSTCAPLLPGFGPDVLRLGEFRSDDWLDTALRAARQLSAMHSPFMIVGYSMGAALAAQVAQQVQCDGVALLAPFWKLEGGWISAAWPLLRRVFRSVRPLRRANFADPKLTAGIAEFLPGLDLQDPDVQQAVREFAVPTSLIDELLKVGRGLARAAPTLEMPLLIGQGLEDPLVRRKRTRALLREVRAPLEYVEVPGAHNLLDPESPGHDRLLRHVTGFAESLYLGRRSSA
jgi:carboxylesterase